MPRRNGQTVWIICLTSENYHSFGEISSLITALPGRTHLLTDLSIFETLHILSEHNLDGFFHQIISRGHTQPGNYVFWQKLSIALKIRRCQRCVLFDTNACSIVAVKLLGWAGCLVTSLENVAHEPLSNRTSDTQLGRGAWYDTRFSTMEKALRHYIFGSIASATSNKNSSGSHVQKGVSFCSNS